MSPLDDIKNDLTTEVGSIRAILHGLQLVLSEEAAPACRSDDLAYLIGLAVQHVAVADGLTERLDQAVTDLNRQERSHAHQQ